MGGPGNVGAYTFRYDSLTDTWNQHQKLMPSDAEPPGCFAYSLAIRGPRAVIGAYCAEGDGSGSAYVFRYDQMTDTWIEEQKLTASDAAPDDWFGYAVAIDDDWVLVGAHTDEPPHADTAWQSGSAYFFHYGPTAQTWRETQKLESPGRWLDHEFGYSASISGDLAVVSAPGDYHGSASLYHLDSLAGSWVLEQHLYSSETYDDYNFGSSVALKDEWLLVGGDEADGYAGMAYIFRRNAVSGVWEEQQELWPSDAAGGDRFGSAVALNGTTAVVGAPGNDDSGSWTGSAYVFQVSGTDCNCNGTEDLCDVVVNGDYDADGDVDLNDYLFFFECADGPDQPPGPPVSDCAAVCLRAFDLDADGDVDLHDFASFQQSFGQ